MPKDVKCKDCDKLKNHWCREVVDSPDEDMVRDCRYFRHKTNADRIRAMTDEELAKFLIKAHDCEVHIPFCQNKPECNEMLDAGVDIPPENCEACMMAWLHRPAEESQ